MRLLLGASALVLGLLALTLPSCQDCPSGGGSGSVFCHAEACAATESDCNGTCTNLSADDTNCGACGVSCGDGLVCSQAQCVEPCPGGATRCDGSCVDTISDTNNCGSCDNRCGGVATCTSGSCTCPSTDVTCGGTCIDPQTDTHFCGATTDCTGTHAGTACGGNEACLAGVCTPIQFYYGSLPASTGTFNYGGMLGLAGADNLCNTHWNHTQHCSYDFLMRASNKTPSELKNATDFNGVAVTDWWIDDPAATKSLRCADSATGDVPWTYATAHLGNVGEYVTLTPATGVISAVVKGSPNRPNPIVGSTALCAQTRFVACCAIP